MYPEGETDTLDNIECILLGESILVENISPNPTTNVFSIPIVLTEAGDITFTVVSASGYIISQETSTAQAGRNLFTFDAASLQSGVYLLEILYDGERTLRTWVKQ